MVIFKKNKSVFWTNHAKDKMRFYKLSEQRVLRVLNFPNRVEEGIAPNTIAIMQPASVKTMAGKPDWRQEIWIMIQKKNQKLKIKNQNYNSKFKDFKNQRQAITKIISVWKYPGKTKMSKPLPEEILRELRDFK